MAEASLVLCSGDPKLLTGKIAYSQELLDELGVDVPVSAEAQLLSREASTTHPRGLSSARLESLRALCAPNSPRLAHRTQIQRSS